MARSKPISRKTSSTKKITLARKPSGRIMMAINTVKNPSIKK